MSSPSIPSSKSLMKMLTCTEPKKEPWGTPLHSSLHTDAVPLSLERHKEEGKGKEERKKGKKEGKGGREGKGEKKKRRKKERKGGKKERKKGREGRKGKEEKRKGTEERNGMESGKEGNPYVFQSPTPLSQQIVNLISPA
ncbi:hypothetical protein L345_06763, partial [Ophiophagus hannah]